MHNAYACAYWEVPKEGFPIPDAIKSGLQDLSGMEALPPVVVESGPAEGVSVIALGKALGWGFG